MNLTELKKKIQDETHDFKLRVSIESATYLMSGTKDNKQAVSVEYFCDYMNEYEVVTIPMMTFAMFIKETGKLKAIYNEGLDDEIVKHEDLEDYIVWAESYLNPLIDELLNDWLKFQ
jgi:hypothetical protein